MLFKRLALCLGCLSAWLLPSIASADFDLEVLFPVAKTVVIPEDADATLYPELEKIGEPTIEIRMSGNMMRDVLIERLNRQFARSKKRVVLRGEVNDIHVKQLRRLEGLEVVYRLGPKGLSDKTFNALYALGPVRKFIQFGAETPIRQLDRIHRLKFCVPVVEVGPGGLPEHLIGWLEQKKQRSIHFILGPDAKPDQVLGLTRFSPLHLEIRTRNNRVEKELYNVLRDLRGVEIVLRVDGRLTLADVKRLTGLERFGIRVDLGSPARYTPGLFRLLGQIAPPGKKRSRNP